MATWECEKFTQQDVDTDEINDNFDSILVTHDLQDCLDDSLDLTNFGKIYEQSGDYDCAKYSDTEDTPFIERPDDTTG